jgi:hypothetical protein
VAGVQVADVAEHQRIDAPEVESVMVVLVGIAYVPVARVITGAVVV